MQANANIWPSYPFISNEKKNCRPPEDSYSITGQEAVFSFKEAAKKTVDRILLIKRVKGRIQDLKNRCLNNPGLTSNSIRLKCHIKVGFDGCVIIHNLQNQN